MAFSSFYQNITKNESFIKGDEFESFLREHIYTSDKFDLVHKTHNFSKNKKDFIETSLYPDFLFRDKKTKEEFYVEAKYREKLFNGKIDWSSEEQLKRYKKIAKEKTTYIAIGFGGRPKFPKVLYIINLMDIKYPDLFPSKIENYKKTTPQKGVTDLIKDKIYN